MPKATTKIVAPRIKTFINKLPPTITTITTTKACVHALLGRRGWTKQLLWIFLPVQTLWHLLTSLLLLSLILEQSPIVHAVGYSYTRFVGPVSGPEQKVYVRDAVSGVTSVDYVAQPNYQFAYGIEDAKQRLLQNRKETRDGDNVHGVYSVVDPDGSLRVVKYTADNVNGFQAVVTTNGVTSIHGHTGNNKNEPIDDSSPDKEYDGRTLGFWETRLPSGDEQYETVASDVDSDEHESERLESDEENEEGDNGDEDHSAENSSYEDFEGTADANDNEEEDVASSFEYF